MNPNLDLLRNGDFISENFYTKYIENNPDVRISKRWFVSGVSAVKISYKLREYDLYIQPKWAEEISFLKANDARYFDEPKAKALFLSTEHVYDLDKPLMNPVEDRLGSWLSAALSDKDTCEEMKQDIRNWFNQFRIDYSRKRTKTDEMADEENKPEVDPLIRGAKYRSRGGLPVEISKYKRISVNVWLITTHDHLTVNQVYEPTDKANFSQFQVHAIFPYDNGLVFDYVVTEWEEVKGSTAKELYNANKHRLPDKPEPNMIINDLLKQVKEWLAHYKIVIQGKTDTKQVEKLQERIQTLTMIRNILQAHNE